jgi:hypothetical protein
MQWVSSSSTCIRHHYYYFEQRKTTWIALLFLLNLLVKPSSNLHRELESCPIFKRWKHIRVTCQCQVMITSAARSFIDTDCDWHVLTVHWWGLPTGKDKPLSDWVLQYAYRSTPRFSNFNIIFCNMYSGGHGFGWNWMDSMVVRHYK